MNYRIEIASLNDVGIFLNWVRKEYSQGYRDNHWLEFKFQIGWLLQRLKEGQIWVLKDTTGIAGYLIGDRENYHLQYLQVKNDRRGLNYGVILADFYKGYLESINAPFMLVECCPRSSLGFWQKRGLKSDLIAESIHLKQNWVCINFLPASEELRERIKMTVLKLQTIENNRLNFN